MHVHKDSGGRAQWQRAKRVRIRHGNTTAPKWVQDALVSKAEAKRARKAARRKAVATGDIAERHWSDGLVAKARARARTDVTSDAVSR